MDKIKASAITQRDIYIQGYTPEFGIAEVDGKQIAVKRIIQGATSYWTPVQSEHLISKILKSQEFGFEMN